MAQYIDKGALVAEINALLDDEFKCNSYDEATGFQNALTLVKKFIDTLEVKEVDLDKELENWLGERIGKWTGKECENMCRYFFELGLSAGNPITATDRGTAEEIIINLKRVEQDYRIDLTKEIEWLRNKVKKGE